MNTEQNTTIKLKHPVTFGSETIESLTFRRGRLGDLKGIDMGAVPSFDKLVLIASRQCGQPIAVLDLLEAEDGSAVLGTALRFFVKCLEDGRGP